MDGTFIVTDVIPGEVKVGYIDSPSGSGSSSGGSKGDAPAPTPSVSLPSKFRDPNMSGLKITVKDDTKEVTIDIK
jgi:hypothetical protein